MLEGHIFPEGFDYFVEGSVRVPGATVEVGSFHWRSAQNVVLKIEKAKLDLALSARAGGVQGGYVIDDERAHSEPPAGPQRYGEMIFLPAGHVLHSRWQASRQRSVSCDFDADGLLSENAVGKRDFERAASLDMRNIFIREAMLRLARETMQPSFSSAILIESLCQVLALEIPRHFGLLRSSREEGISSRLGPDQLKRIEERVSDAGTALPTVAELAAECGVSARHFSRVFRQTTGMTVGHFVTQRRIIIAKDSLVDRSISIKRISHRCGFQSVPAFSAAFRRETGLTPRQFRYAVFENGANGA